MGFKLNLQPLTKIDGVHTHLQLSQLALQLIMTAKRNRTILRCTVVSQMLSKGTSKVDYGCSNYSRSMKNFNRTKLTSTTHHQIKKRRDFYPFWELLSTRFNLTDYIYFKFT